MELFVTTLYADNGYGHVHVMAAESKQDVISHMEAIFEAKYVNNEWGEYLVYDHLEPNFDETNNCWSIAIGACNKNGFAYGAVQW